MRVAKVRSLSAGLDFGGWIPLGERRAEVLGDLRDEAEV